MSWIALRDRPGGWARYLETQGRPALMARGSLMLELEMNDQGLRQPLIDAFAPDPWPAAISLAMEPDGALILSLTHNGALRRLRLETGLRSGDSGITVCYAWDAPARMARLTAYSHDTGAFHLAHLQAPPPLPDALASCIMTASLGSGVRYLALGDHLAPAGPMPALGGRCVVQTPLGHRRVDEIAPGDEVTTASGEFARVLWSGSAELPALGRHRPLRLRAPYFGARRDQMLAPGQRLTIGGSEVEYLFGEESVLASARHLTNQSAIVPCAARNTVRYYHLLLDRHDVLIVGGAEMESFDPGPVLGDPDLRAASVLADLPDVLLPRSGELARPMLRPFEAVTLAALRAA